MRGSRSVIVRVDDSNDADFQAALLKDAMVLHLFRHAHIVALLHVARFGAVVGSLPAFDQATFCTNNNSLKMPLYVVTEHLVNGDLWTFLHECRPAAARPRVALTSAVRSIFLSHFSQPLITFFTRPSRICMQWRRAPRLPWRFSVSTGQ